MSESGFTVSLQTLARLGRGDAAEGRRLLRALIDLELDHSPIDGPTPKPIGVRAAMPADEDGIMALIRADIAENAQHVAPINETACLAFVRRATQDGEATIGVIDNETDGIVGMIAFMPYSWWWSDRWFVQELFCYLDATHRSAKNFRDLIRFSRWFVDDLSERLGYRVYLLSGVTAPRAMAMKMVAYRRLTNPIGAFFVYPSV